MEITICPGKAPRRAAVPLSKSEGHRALILAAMAQGETLLPRLPASGDLLATMDCLRQMGTRFTERENSLLVTPIAGPPAAPLRLDCRESGSTLRFLLPVAAALGLRAIFTGRGRLPQRPVEALLAALQRNGITAEVRQHPWEIELAGRLTPGAFSLPGNVSSQYVSGLMLALPLLTGPSEIRLTGALESAGYAGMTEEMLRRFGLELEKTPMGWRIPGGMKYQSPGRLALGGDWSHAAFWLAAGCLAGPVTVTGLEPESTQPDRVILPLLRQMGARIELSPEGITAYPHRLTGTTIDVSGCPDLLPPLAAAMAFAKGESRLTGMAGLLRALGGRVEEEPDGLRIAGSGLRGGVADPCGDHRLAMAAAVAALACREPVTIKDAECVEKSYPAWWGLFCEEK